MGAGSGSTEFSADELALIPPPDDATQDAPGAQASDAGEQGGAPASGDSGAPGAAGDQGDQQQAPSLQQAGSGNAPGEAAPSAAPQRPAGDLRNALRASRRAEHLARQEAERLRQENEQLKANPGAKPAADESALSDDEIEALSRVDPVMGKVARLALKVATSAPPTAQQEARVEPEFLPPILPPAVQEAVDDVPEILAWQNTPDQRAFEAAKRVDAYLQGLEAWKAKPMAERLQEVARRVIADNPSFAPGKQQQRTDPSAAIANAPRHEPTSISDLGGGGKQTEPGLLEKWSRPNVTDDDILADLQRSPG